MAQKLKALRFGDQVFDLTGKADLVGGKVPAEQLPSYVDDVIEVADFAGLPATGEAGKIYITIDNGKIFRWGGSVFAEIPTGPQDIRIKKRTFVFDATTFFANATQTTISASGQTVYVYTWENNGVTYQYRNQRQSTTPSQFYVIDNLGTPAGPEHYFSISFTASAFDNKNISILSGRIRNEENDFSATKGYIKDPSGSEVFFNTSVNQSTQRFFINYLLAFTLTDEQRKLTDKVYFTIAYIEESEL